jgi:erythromycin esterase-like protein
MMNEPERAPLAKEHSVLNQIPPQLGWNMTDPSTALNAFLSRLPAAPQLLGLGEPTHGVEVFPLWRNQIFHTLVEKHGFRSIALESDIIAGLGVNTHVTTNRNGLDEVMRTGFSHGFGSSPANRDLVEWMSAFNAGREPSDHLRFYGFDAPLENMWAASPRASLLELHAFLSTHLREMPVDAATLEQLCGEDAPWINQAAAMDPSKSIGKGDEARQLRLLADNLWNLLRTETPQLAGHAGYWEAKVHARTAAGLLRYHAIVADPAPNRVARMLALRDLMMADNLNAIAQCEAARGPTLVFAHNTHLQRHKAAMTMRGTRLEWWGAGAHINLRFGHRYALIVSVLGSAPQREIGEPAADTLEGNLMSLATPVNLFSTEALSAALSEQAATRTDIPTQAGYFPLEPAHLSLTDGVLFIRNASDSPARISLADHPTKGAS